MQWNNGATISPSRISWREKSKQKQKPVNFEFSFCVVTFEMWKLFDLHFEGFPGIFSIMKLEEYIAKALGYTSFVPTSHVGGGCISKGQTFIAGIGSSKKKIFVKQNSESIVCVIPSGFVHY